MNSSDTNGLEGGKGRRLVEGSEWRGGCLFKSSSKVSLLRGASVSSEVTSLRAPWKSPSSSLAATKSGKPFLSG